MKKNIFIYLIIGVAFLFFGCTEDSILVDEMNQKNDEIISSKVERTEFTGTCNWVSDEYEGEMKELPFFMELLKGQSSYWYDEANDPRVTGITFWTVNYKQHKNGDRTYWGKAELVVDDDGGIWEMSWHGWWTWTDGVPEIVVDATGVGKEGAVKGLFAKWTYTFNFGGFYYMTEGYIQGK